LANDALGATDGEDILIGDTAEKLAKNILKLLNDEELYQKIAENGYRFVKQTYNWAQAVDKLNNIIRGK